MFCNQCGQSIADDSRFCKFCGAAQAASAQSVATEATAAVPTDRTPKKGNAGKIIGAIVAVFFVLVVIGALTEKPATAPADGNLVNLTDNLDTAVATDAAAPPAATTGNWSYSTDVDKVRGGTTYFATTTSTNSIHQDFPYDSSTTMTMTLRQSPAYGIDVILTISSGQMMCPSYEGCSGTVSFDGGPAERVQFNGPEDNSSETVFVVGARPFIAKVRKAKKVVIEKTLYQAGAPQFEFDVSGLKWDH